MWICLNDAFFSIVASDRDPEVLNVRARRRGDIEAHFPGQEVLAWKGRDYPFRAFVPRHVVAEILASQVRAITYPNFKDSVGDPRLHEVYADVWAVMAGLQRGLRRPRGPYRR